MKTNTDYKNAALAALKGNWAKAVLATVVLLFVIYMSMGPYAFQTVKMQTYMQETIGTPASGSLLSVFTQSMNRAVAMAQDPEYLAMQQKVNGSMGLYYLLLFFVVLPLVLGYANALLRLLTRGEDDVLGNMARIATKNYWHKVWGMFLMQVFIFLWSLLFVIPGIIKSLSYAMTPYILEENPELSANEAIDRSRAMMKGHKFDYFWLLLSFIGWGFLCVFTLGIGLLWLTPYMQTAVAAFYEDVKADYEVNGGLI